MSDDLTSRLSDELGQRYAIEAPAGEGGMAVVYRARDLRHGRTVALKMLDPEVSLTFGVERFRREIDIAARLQHPNILPVFDSGEAAGVLYYVMPFADGASLRERLDRDHRLALDDALAIAVEVADALGWAHRHGVVHRDIKPENILFAAGHALVADFGIARAIDHSRTTSGITEPGFGLGTPAYMSPEQAFGEPLDARSDVYSLGCVLYEMLTGGAPYSGVPLTAMLLQKTTRDVPLVSASVPVPAHVDVAVSRALARDAVERFADAGELKAALVERQAPPAPRPSRPVEPPPPSVAVLPFVEAGGDSKENYFADGLADELIHALGATKGLRVIGRTTSFAVRDRDAATLARQLGVDYVLRGTVRRADTRLRIMAHLVESRTGFEVWSERYDRQLVDVFEIQDDITRAIVAALRAELLPQGEAQAPAGGIDVYDTYLKARHEWSRRSVTGMQRSIALLEQAVEADRSFAAAQSALAETHLTLAIYGTEAPSVAMPAARAAAEAALAVDPLSGEARSALACVRALWEWDWSRAAEDFRSAIEASPQYRTVHQWYAMHVLAPRRQFPLALRQLLRARELDPLSPSVAVSIALTHMYARDYDAAASALEELVARDRDFAPAHVFLGQLYGETGRTAEGVRLIERAIALSDSPEWTAALGEVHARARDATAARAALERLEAFGRPQYVSPVLRARVHAALGEDDAALAALDEAIALRATDLIWLGVRSVFDGLRARERFVTMAEKIGVA
ncbi:MAG TPA: protein kinase [Gemmatimonadaceae bacterium]|nr:protein kinase [Gemmatimonadaceae bacterium]